jgi:single-stranded-DNA-specific exonuclease
LWVDAVTPSLSWTGARWTLLGADEARVRELVAGGLLDAAARCMSLRGLGLAQVRDLPDLDRLHDPYLMRHMDLAVDRLRVAAQRGERVRILTDYDVDGTTSSLILQATLRIVAPNVTLDYHIPDRFTEGYGFSVAAARKAAADGVGLLITADIGVRDHLSVAAAREAGCDVMICDHHLPAGAEVPEGAIVLCPPQVACTYPNRSLAACGVSLKLAQALLADDPRRPRVLRSLLKLAAIGTVADLVSLGAPENRAIVQLGLEELNRGPHQPGLAALLDVCRVTPGSIDESDLAFRVAPRINAAGRIAQATHVVDLLATPDPAVAQRLAAELDALNTERRQVQQHLVDTVLEAIPSKHDGFVVVAGPESEGWHRGVIGIVAARLKDEVHRPVAVVSIQGEVAVGSVRSVPGVHAVEALESAADLLLRFGGHPAAAGFSLPSDRIGELRERLNAWMDRFTAEDALVVEREIDAVVGLDELDEALLAQLERMRPFGMGNPEPRLCVRAPRAVGVRRIGKAGTHLTWTLPRSAQGGPPLEAVWWDGAAHAGALSEGPCDLIGKLEARVWNGRRSLRFVVTDGRSVDR